MTSDNKVIITPKLPVEDRSYSNSQKVQFFVSMIAHNPETTGSFYLMEVNFPCKTKYNILVDAGAFPEPANMEKNYNVIEEIKPEKIDCVFLTHSHDDHIGLIAYLVRNGYAGPIYCSEFTSCMLRPMLNDRLNIMRQSMQRSGDKILFEERDIAKTLKQVVVIKENVKFKLRKDILVTPFENSHIKGALYLYFEILPPKEYFDQKPITVLFTGDRKTNNLLFSTKPIPEYVFENTTVIVEETTYGSRSEKEINFCFEDEVKNHFKNGGKMLIIGAFAQERAQLFGYLISKMKAKGDLKSIPVFVDGKLSFQVSEIYQDHIHEFDKVKNYNFTQNKRIYGKSVFETLPPKEQKICIERSKLIEDNKPCIIITTAGMFSHGPICEYLAHKLEDEKATFIVPGYAAKGTVARLLQESEKGELISLLGFYRQLKANIVFLNEFSGHDRVEKSLEFRKQFKSVTLDILVHGDVDSRHDYALAIFKKLPNVSRHIVSLGDDNMVRFGQYGLIKVVEKQVG